MGMGEPLFNYDNLIKSIHILRDRNGLNFPTDGINVSTVGPVEATERGAFKDSVYTLSSRNGSSN